MDIGKEQPNCAFASAKPQVDAGGVSTRRYPWIAALLALLTPIFAMLYVARGWRALGYLAASIGLLVLVIMLNAFVGMSMSVGEVLGPVVLGLVGAIDGYRLAKAWRESGPLPWYARWPGLASIVVITILTPMALRAFVIEPFHIPSGGMNPTLVVGDYILAKGTYLLRAGEPSRGDVMVFFYPVNSRIKYIQRVVGVPGDRVAYFNKQLTINDQAVPMTAVSDHSNSEAGLNYSPTKQYREDLDGHQHAVLIQRDVPPIQLVGVRQFPHREACEYSEQGFVCTVPQGHYFMMGDNRDASNDSRYWGFVPEGNLVGRALMIWSSAARPDRIGLKVE